MSAKPGEPIRSFCTRVINLCTNVEDANKLTYLKGVQAIAKMVRQEAEYVQTIYGGHPAKIRKEVSRAGKAHGTRAR